jgi:hypothetical protein
MDLFSQKVRVAKSHRQQDVLTVSLPSSTISASMTENGSIAPLQPGSDTTFLAWWSSILFNRHHIHIIKQIRDERDINDPYVLIKLPHKRHENTYI